MANKKTEFLDAQGNPVSSSPGGPVVQSSGPLSGQSTVMLDSAQAAPRQQVTPTMMKERPRDNLPPMRRPAKESTAGRWIAGPIIAIVFAAGTAALAGVVMPYGPKKPVAKPQGRLKLSTNPAGASVMVDGKVHPRFTPTVIEGDVGANVQITFKLDGYKPKIVEATVRAGETPFGVALDRDETPKPQPVEPPPQVEKPKREHHHSSRDKEPVLTGKGTLTVKVRPWAIVYVDGTRLRQTPVVNFELPAGKHTIELVNEGKNRREKVNVTIKPDDPQEITRDWDKD
jgi:serine/threonine-protein kinase